MCIKLLLTGYCMGPDPGKARFGHVRVGGKAQPSNYNSNKIGVCNQQRPHSEATHSPRILLSSMAVLSHAKTITAKTLRWLKYGLVTTFLSEDTYIHTNHHSKETSLAQILPQPHFAT